MRMSARLAGPLPCAVVLAVAIHVCGLARPPVGRLPTGATPDDRVDERIEGTIGGPVVTMPRGVGAPLHVAQMDATTVWVWSPKHVEPGQRVAVTGRLRTPRGFLDPGSPDLAARAATRGASWEFDAARVELVADEADVVDRAWRWAARVQDDLTETIIDQSTDPARAALAGIVTGDRTAIPPELDARWRAIGIFHVLSVSGLHLAVVAGLLFLLLRRLIAASPLGARCNPALWAAPIAFVLAVAYTLVTGAQLATLRALIVVAIVMAAQMMNRPIRLLEATGTAAIVILVWRPQDLYDPSFQLSFIAALTLAVAPTDARVDAASTGRLKRVARKLRRGLATSAWVAITTAPITALHFQQVAAGGVVGNLVLTPIVELAALPLGLAGAVLHCQPLVALAAWLVARVDDGAALLSHVVPVCTVGLGSPALCVVLVGAALAVCATSRERGRVASVGWIVLCGAWALAPRGPAPGTLRVTFLDVGQGDAALIEVPDGEVWLVDAGGLASSRDVLAASAPGEAITRTLAVYGHDAIDVAVLSHPHPDHFMGLAGLGVPVRELWLADRDAERLPVVEALRRRGTRIVVPPLGAARTAGDVVLRVLAPRLDDALAPDPVRTVNDNSLVVALEYAGRRVLFPGDIEAEGEAALVAAGLPHVDVVKVPHHGSRTSSSGPFVAATRPALAVISCGVANAFGFPAPEVVERWRTIGAAVARTDLDGAVIVTVARDGRLHVGR